MSDRRITHRFLLGLGLDADGHARVTKGEEFLLVGGSEKTHQRMQEGVERLCETLRKMGTDLQRAPRKKLLEAARESGLNESES